MIVIKAKKSVAWLLLSGLLLSIGNLFRMVAIVIIIAYIMYLMIYWNRKEIIKSSIFILVSFFIPLYVANAVLLNLKITEYSLWRGSEPVITSVLKGTNIQALGTWNEEDSKIAEKYNYDYHLIEVASKAIIKQRLTTTPLYKLFAFYIIKFMAQWSFGDFGGIYWSTGGLRILNTIPNLTNFITLYCQIFYLTLLIFTYRGLFNTRQYLNNKPINLFYIIFCGYGLFYLVTEQQPRYGYIVSWLFVLVGLSCAEIVFRKKNNRDIIILQENYREFK